MEHLPTFALHRPKTPAEAVALIAAARGGRWLSGGTDLLPNLRRGLGEPTALIDLSGVEALQAVATAPGGGLRIGAGVTLARIAADAAIRDAFPSIAAAAACVAGPSHRAVATLGGNLALDTRCVYYNQSLWFREGNGFCLKHGGSVCHVAPTGNRCHAAFSGDLAPALIALGAIVETTGPGGVRREPLEDLYAEDGTAHLRLSPGELIVAVEIGREDGIVDGYEKARQRDAIDFPLAGVAVALSRDGDVVGRLRVALTGTNSCPVLLPGTDRLIGRPLDEAALKEIETLVQRKASPMRTTTAAAHYRRRVAAALARRLAVRLFEAAPSKRPAPCACPIAGKAVFVASDRADSPPAPVEPAPGAELAVGLDVRPILAEGKDPRGQILAAVGNLPAGGVLVLEAPFDPIPLRRLLASRGFSDEARMVADGHWRILFRRGPASPAAATRTAGGATVWREGDGMHIDVRGLEPPQPMLEILALVETGTADRIVVHHEREPHFLYPELAERGWGYELAPGAEGEVRLILTRDRGP